MSSGVWKLETRGLRVSGVERIILDSGEDKLPEGIDMIASTSSDTDTTEEMRSRE